MSEYNDDFEVVVSSQLGDDTEVVTVVPKIDIAEWEDQQLFSAIQKVQNGKIIYSPRTSDTESVEELTIDKIDELATNMNNTLSNVLNANAIIRQRVLTDDLIGRVYESVYSNINTEYKLSYPNPEGRNKQKTVTNVKRIIDDFNRQINIENLIRESISGVFLEGNRILNLRCSDGVYTIDHMPLGLAYVSDYTANGVPILCVDIKQLESRLKKTYSMTKKRKAVFFENVKQDIENNYPEQVYKDYIAGESISKLDTRYARIIRVNSMGRKYGVSPIFRALKAAVVLDNLMKTDISISKSKQRKILVQILRKEVITELRKKGLVEAVHAHSQLMDALKTTSCAYTAAPFVERLEYVSPPKDDTNADKLNQYQRRELNALGIEYIDTQSGTVSVANISLNQLLRLINAIGEQLERVLEDYYRVVLEDNHIDPIYAPSIRIIDSEQLDADLRQNLATFVFSNLGASFETAYKILGFNIEDELSKREAENNNNITEIFKPRPTAYTTSNTDDSGDGKEAGRPKKEGEETDVEKQERDKIVRSEE